MVRQDLMGNAGMEILHKIVNDPRWEAPCDGLDPLMAKADWAQLARDGFTVIRGFCSAEEVRAMKELYDAMPANENKNYQAKNAEFPAAVAASPPRVAIVGLSPVPDGVDSAQPVGHDQKSQFLDRLNRGRKVPGPGEPGAVQRGERSVGAGRDGDLAVGRREERDSALCVKT